MKIMMRIFKTALFLLSFVAFMDVGRAATNCDEAKAFMNDMGTKVITLLTDHSISDQKRANEFRVILEKNFDVKAIGKFVLGRYWKQATAEEQKAFLNLFKETTVATYATRFKEYTSEKFVVLSCQCEADDGVIVSTQIVRPGGQVVPICWKIFDKKGEMRIYDVIIEGISMGITQRSEFASVIQNGGGRVESLNAALENKLEHSSLSLK